MLVSGGVHGVRFPAFHRLLVVLRNPPSCWRFLLTSGNSGFASSPELAAWLEAHPQREDLYSALRPLFVDCPR